MKKIFTLMAACSMLALASCGGSNSSKPAAETAADSTVVTVDSAAVATVDSAAVAVDSAAVAVDSVATK